MPRYVVTLETPSGQVDVPVTAASEEDAGQVATKIWQAKNQARAASRGHGRKAKASGVANKVGFAGEAIDLAEGSGLPPEGVDGGAMDRYRHRAWNALMAQRGLGDVDLGPVANVGPAFAAGTALEAYGAVDPVLKLAQRIKNNPRNIFKALEKFAPEIKESLNEGAADLRSNVMGLYYGATSDTEEEALDRAMDSVLRDYPDVRDPRKPLGIPNIFEELPVGPPRRR